MMQVRADLQNDKLSNAELSLPGGDGVSSGSEAPHRLSPERRRHIQLAPTNVLAIPKNIVRKSLYSWFKFPVRAYKFPVLLQKFPVLVRREFAASL
jgi:hypothetical protein